MADTTTTKVYISMPQEFLEQVDHVAHLEHLSRSALIREALKLYMHQRRPLFFQLSEELRDRFRGIPEENLESLIDQTVAEVRAQRT